MKQISLMSPVKKQIHMIVNVYKLSATETVRLRLCFSCLATDVYGYDVTKV